MAQIFTNGNSITVVNVKRTTTVQCSVSTNEGTMSCTLQQTEESTMTQSTMVNHAQEAMRLIMSGINPKNLDLVNK